MAIHTLDPGFGEVFRRLRVRAGLSQRSLARQADVSYTQLAALEAGQNVSVEFLVKVARALGMSEIPIPGLRLVGTLSPTLLSPLLALSQHLVELAESFAKIGISLPSLEDARAGLEAVIDTLLRSPSDSHEDEAIAFATRLLESPAMEAERALRRAASSSDVTPPAVSADTPKHSTSRRKTSR